ncbi:MAG: hypothetical protein FD146_1717 [Anaerolineaceae bacterium]|nr:MAG: hypothetical protein FD146_1717 [Anaerolineaceae bacterium]
MNEPATPQKERDRGREIIIASTIVIMTCILSCAAVLIVLILRAA